MSLAVAILYIPICEKLAGTNTLGDTLMPFTPQRSDISMRTSDACLVMSL